MRVELKGEGCGADGLVFLKNHFKYQVLCGVALNGTWSRSLQWRSFRVRVPKMLRNGKRSVDGEDGCAADLAEDLIFGAGFKRDEVWAAVDEALTTGAWQQFGERRSVVT